MPRPRPPHTRSPRRRPTLASPSALVLVLGLYLLAPASALADCAQPLTFVVPASGAELPSEPTVWVFAHDWPEALPTVTVTDGAGNALEAAVELVSDHGAVRALRVELPARSGEVVVAVDHGGRPLEARYTIAKEVPADETPAALAPVSIVATEHEVRAWTCSHQDTLNLKLDQPAAAYRLEWAATEDDWRAGEREQVVLPPQMLGFFRADQVDVREPGVLELGHVDCTGHTFRGPTSVLYVGVVAIGLDGRETPLPAEPTLLTCKSCQ